MHESNFTDDRGRARRDARAAGGALAGKPERNLYVSLGDSYASGFQPTAPGVGRNTRNGFAYQVPGLARPRGYKLKLVTFGCSGETTVSLLERTTAMRRARPGRRRLCRHDAAHDLPPYGQVPKAVADVRGLTYFCEFGDIHARNSGYRVIARLIARSLPRRG